MINYKEIILFLFQFTKSNKLEYIHHCIGNLKFFNFPDPVHTTLFSHSVAKYSELSGEKNQNPEEIKAMNDLQINGEQLALIFHI